MAKDFAQSFYNSAAWKACREAYKHQVAYICERCGAPGVIVHHKIRVSPETIQDPAVLLNFDNLELLCRDCHAKEHEEDERTRRKKKEQTAPGGRFTVDEEGKIRGIW